MYIIKNAFISIFRNKGRNILVGIIIMVIASSCAITLAIRSSADKIVTSYENKYPVTVTIGMNRANLTKSFKENASSQEEMIENFNEIEPLTIEDIDAFGDSDYVSKYNYTYSVSLNGKDIEEATDSLVKETTTTKTETETKTETFTNPAPSRGDYMPPFGGDNGGSTETKKSTTQRKTTTTQVENIRNERASKGVFTLQGYNSYEAMSEFISGNYTITDGEVSSDFTSNNCVISEELATLNELKVGDTITLVSPDDESITYDLNITGIYKENTEEASDMRSMFSNSVNTIITNVTTVKDVVSKDEDFNPTVSPTYILKDKDDIEAFEKEVTDKGLSEYYMLSDNIETIENATKSIISVKSFATTFLIITLIIGAVVLLVINMINIRERKYEIGVLRTIGMRKSLVSLQFMFELLVVCIVFLLIGAGIGGLTSVKVSNKLLANEIENAETDMDAINDNFGGKMRDFRPEEMGITQLESIETMDAIVDIKVLGELLLIGAGLTIVGSIASMVSISRFSPLTILKERS